MNGRSPAYNRYLAAKRRQAVEENQPAGKMYNARKKSRPQWRSTHASGMQVSEPSGSAARLPDREDKEYRLERPLVSRFKWPRLNPARQCDTKSVR